MANPNTFLHVHEVARTLGLTTNRVRQLADAGRLPVTRTSCGWRLFERDDVEVFKASRQDNGHSK